MLALFDYSSYIYCGLHIVQLVTTYTSENACFWAKAKAV